MKVMLFKWFLAFTPLLLFFNPILVDEKPEKLKPKQDTLVVMLMRIDDGDKIRYRRINGTKFTYPEYCELLEAIVNEGLCEICDDNNVY